MLRLRGNWSCGRGGGGVINFWGFGGVLWGGGGIRNIK
jgi:hypothetical protein